MSSRVVAPGLGSSAGREAVEGRVGPCTQVWSLLLSSSCVFIFQNQETREILHFHYTTWPDFGVPESPASFLNFLFKVRESGSLSPEHGPIVVHCSAGIGRSGTFCLADTCLLLVRQSWEAPRHPSLAPAPCCCHCEGSWDL